MPGKRMTRRERLALARTVLNGTVTGIARAVTTWLLNQLSS